VNFLRRLLGGGEPASEAAPAGADDDAEPSASADELELQHERDLLRGEAQRLDELQQRQLRYADRAWTPPAQGGEQRADDGAQSEG
jgi:hypothetical protein